MDFIVSFLHIVSSCLIIYTDGLTQGRINIEPIYKSAASEFSSHEIVEPVIYKHGRQLVSTFTQDGHHQDIVIKLSGPQTRLTLNLRRNDHLLSTKYVEKNYQTGDRYNLKRPNFKKLQKHCHYHGSVAGRPHSQVAVSTCYGISGYIDDGHDSLHIEPAFDLNQTAHRLYRDRNSLLAPFKCGTPKREWPIINNISRQMEHKKEIIHRMKRSIGLPYDANINSRYVEMYIVNDFKTYDSYGRDERRLIHGTQTIINIVSRLYQPFNIYVVLVGIESWMDGSPRFAITSEADTTLENFLHYRKNRINAAHPNDNAQLITGTTFSKGVVGKALKGTICTYQYSGGVNLNLPTPGQTATTIAHELGHNFGMDHDNYTICQCKEDKCIMAATSGGTADMRLNTPTHWSSCSMLALQEAFEMGMDYCLKNQPETLPAGPVCGNGFAEEGEECDCGFPEDCKNRCCNATTCLLTPGSACATGDCCDLGSCKPKAAASLCRAAVSECDLPEFCWGDKPECPADVFLQDGVDCMGGQSYCFKGQCKTYTGQCKLLWGNTGRVSDPVCFRTLNTNGSKHGNCGYNWTNSRYEPCYQDDVMCGLLHCVHQNEKLMFWKDSLTHATPATFLTMGSSTYICRGAMLDVGLDMPDPGMVPEGAKCDNRKICVDHKCTSLSYLSIPACSEGCSDRGVCNSKGHCHCEEHFGPPLCDVSGYGGSVDSGPISLEESNGTLIGLLVFFLVIVPLLGIAVFLAYRYRVQIQAWVRQNLEKSRKTPSRPAQPARPPPKRDAASNQPAYQNQPLHNPTPIVVNNNRPAKPPAAAGRSNISGPVLMDSTHKDTRPHMQRSPVAAKKQQQPPAMPPKWNKPTEPAAASVPTGQHKPLPVPPVKPSVSLSQKPKSDSQLVDKGSNPDSKSDLKSKFGPILSKFPSFSIGDKPGSSSPKVEVQKEEEIPVANIVKKRELNREISNPVLISTTDRRSKHLVKLENLQVKPPVPEESKSLAPHIPPHVSLNRSESDSRHRNRPLPPRPLSMPESECGDEEDFHVKDNRKSIAGPPQRPSAPPAGKRPSMDQVRLNMEEELAKIDSIQIGVFEDSNGSNPDLAPGAGAKKKDIKPKPRVVASKPNSGGNGAKKPIVPSKSSAARTGSDPQGKVENSDVKRPVFNPKDRPGFSKPSNTQNAGKRPGASQHSDSEVSVLSGRKVSTDSLDEDAGSGSASVAGLAKRFTEQQKPLLTGSKPVSKTRSHDDTKAPMTPPKPRPGVKKVRSVHV